MEIKANELNKILNKYGYKLVFDKIHSDSELKKFASKEPNFGTHKYLTIKTKNNIVIGRIYTQNSPSSIPLSKVTLNEKEIEKVLAFFKFFKIKNHQNIIKILSSITKLDPNSIEADVIRNNVYQIKPRDY